MALAVKTPAPALPSLPDAILQPLFNLSSGLWNLYDQISRASPLAAEHLHVSPSGRSSPPHEHGAPGNAEDEIHVQFDNLPPGAQVSTRASGATLHVDGARARTSPTHAAIVETAAHRISGTPETLGMSKDNRAGTLDAQMTALGAAKNPDGSYGLDHDTITFDNRYVLDKPKIDAHGGSVWDPDTAHYFDTLEQERAFLANPRNSGYGEVGAMSPLNSRKTTMYAGSVDSGYSSGNVRFNYYKDDAGNIGSYSLPLSQNLAENIYHEIGHAVYGDAAEEAADTGALEKLNLAGPSVIDPPPSSEPDKQNALIQQIDGREELQGMSGWQRQQALDAKMKEMGAKKNDDGTYSIGGDTITYKDYYVEDLTTEKDGGSHFEPGHDKQHISHSLKEERDWISGHPGYKRVGAASPLGSHTTTLYAGSVDSGFADSATAHINYYKDKDKHIGVYDLPVSELLEEHIRHEIGHAVYGDGPEALADTRALKAMNRSDTTYFDPAPASAPASDAGHGDGGAPPPPPSPSTHASASGTGGTARATGDEESHFQAIPINGVQPEFRVMLPSETGASDIGNLGEVTNSVKMLPDYVLSNLVNNGVKWIVVPDSADQGHPEPDPRHPEYDMTKEKPEGWNPAGTPPDAMRDWGDADSQYHTEDKTVVVGTPDEHHDGDNSINVTLHETGHAYDYENRFPSRQRDFRKAYALDAPNMTTDAEQTATDFTDSYFLQGGNRGPEETFAEGFARYYSHDPDFQKDWPNVYDYFVKFDARLKAEAQARSGR